MLEMLEKSKFTLPAFGTFHPHLWEKAIFKVSRVKPYLEVGIRMLEQNKNPLPETLYG
jgi:hypothetical protein